MTTQELFIGHFEGALTTEESLHLETLLSGSAELRAQFDQHQHIHSMMLREAQETKPSEALDDATIGAALGLLGQTIGGSSIAFWSGTKIAATIGTVVVGGAVTWFAVTQNPEPQAPAINPPTPTVQTVPAPQVQEPEMVQGESIKSDQPNDQALSTSRSKQGTINAIKENGSQDQIDLDLKDRKPDVVIESDTMMNKKNSQ